MTTSLFKVSSKRSEGRILKWIVEDKLFSICLTAPSRTVVTAMPRVERIHYIFLFNITLMGR